MLEDRIGILAISLGTAPAVITETIWALRQKETPLPVQEVHVVTTATGLGKLGPVIDGCEQTGWRPGTKLIELCQDISIDVPKVRVWLPKGGDGVLDMNTVADCAAFADCVCAMLCDLTGRADTMVHLSIAGGRKTMSYHAGAAMTIYGRAQDSISQILVEPQDLELCPDFWWPQRDPMAHTSFKPRGSDHPVTLSTHVDEVELTLVETPFYRARQWIPARYLKAPPSFDRMMQIANAARHDGKLVIDFSLGKVTIGGADMGHLSPQEFAMLATVAQLARDEKPRAHLNQFKPGEPINGLFEQFRQNIKRSQYHHREDSGERVPRSVCTSLRKALRTQIDCEETTAIFAPVLNKGVLSIAALPEQIEIIGASPIETQGA